MRDRVSGSPYAYTFMAIKELKIEISIAQDIICLSVRESTLIYLKVRIK